MVGLFFESESRPSDTRSRPLTHVPLGVLEKEVFDTPKIPQVWNGGYLGTHGFCMSAIKEVAWESHCSLTGVTARPLQTQQVIPEALAKNQDLVVRASGAPDW